MQSTEEPTATPLPPSASALAYLGELECAAELAGIEFEEARAADRRNFLLGPERSQATGPKDGAMNAPELNVMSRIQDAAAGRLRAAEKTLGFVAWWWATSAITVLEQRVAGRETTARDLERVTLHLPPAAREELEASPWMRPADLPADGAHGTGNPRVDDPMFAALAALKAADAAACHAEMINNDPRDGDYDDLDGQPPGYISDHEAAELHDLEARADRIPALLLAYAHAASDVARYHHHNRPRSN